MLTRMDRSFRWFSLLLVSIALAACGTMRSSVVVEPTTNGGGAGSQARSAMPARTPIPGGSYVVAKGDTLYSIAFRKGVDFRDLAQWNGIAAPYTIWPGQRLTLSPPSLVAASGKVVASSHSVAPAAPVFQSVDGAQSASSTAPSSAHATGAVPTAPAPPSPAKSASVETVPVAGVSTIRSPPAIPASRPGAAGAVRVAGGVNWRWPVNGSLISRFNRGDAIPGIEIAGQPGEPVRAAAAGVVVYSGNGLVGYGELVIIKHNDSFLSAYGHNRKRLVKEGQQVTAGQPIAEMGSTGATRNELEFQIRKDGNPVDPLSYLPSR
ncbi:MAG: LysM peptidoglycan-binding domain-containing protein [Rhodanobacter sp.]|nr:MAG: LysM peptidoglycan-binding domain-containing protein [Rhodanobacter sp.]TAM41687.1 MAG: LysM peptidoglycan-binding domain-containing protein [Rhodanobacter sp.]TAN26307.1 MAG: LysM peptidoglycan-binding domain-containing protein [Rhodanobacter sp.]